MKDSGLDCYILDRDGKCTGPISAARAQELLAVSPFGLLLLRSGYSPIWSEDLEGVSLTLGQAAVSRPVPPDPNLALAKRDLFDGSLAFSAVASAHYTEHKGWFETNRAAGRAKVIPVVDSSIDLISRYPDRARPSGKRFSKVIIGSSTVIVGAAFLGVWFRSAWSRSELGGLFSGVVGSRHAPVSQSPYDRVDFGSLGGAQNKDAAGGQSASKGAGDSSAGGLAARSIQISAQTSVRERSPEAMRLLSQVVSAKLAGDPAEFAERMLGLVPYYRFFQPDFIPPPEFVGAQAVAFMEPIRRDQHAAWQPIAGILKPNVSHGLYGLANSSRKLEDHLAKMGSWATSAPLITDALWSGYRRGIVAESSNGISSETAYWGKVSGLAPESVTAREGAQDLIEILTQLGGVAAAGLPRSELGSYLLSRSLAMANVWGAGSGDTQLGRNISALSEGALRQVNEVDSRILKLIATESMETFTPASLQARIAKRIGFIRALHQENGFLCAPDRSPYGLEFLLQTVRLAGMLAVPLPALHPIYNACFFKPFTESSASEVAFQDESAVLLSYNPSIPSPFSPEWRLFKGKFDGAPSGQAPDMSPEDLSILREWLALVAFSSNNSSLRESVARSMVNQDCARAVATRGQKSTKEQICLQARWYALAKSDVSGRKELLKEIDASYGLKVANQVFYPWFASLYIEPRIEENMPSEPRALARKFDLDRYVDSGQPGYTTLQWFARQGMQR